MGRIEFEIPKGLEFIEKVPNIDWSILFKKVLKEKLDRILRLKKIINKSKLTEKDVEELSGEFDESLYKRYHE